MQTHHQLDRGVNNLKLQSVSVIFQNNGLNVDFSITKLSKSLHETLLRPEPCLTLTVEVH